MRQMQLSSVVFASLAVDCECHYCECRCCERHYGERHSLFAEVSMLLIRLLLCRCCCLLLLPPPLLVVLRCARKWAPPWRRCRAPCRRGRLSAPYPQPQPRYYTAATPTTTTAARVLAAPPAACPARATGRGMASRTSVRTASPRGPSRLRGKCCS